MANIQTGLSKPSHNSLLHIKSEGDKSWESKGLCRNSRVLLPLEIEALEDKYGRELTEEELDLENTRKLYQIFFPTRGETPHTAQAFCARCPVEQSCLEFSLVNGERFGVWGRAPYRTRRRARSMRRRVQAAKRRGEVVDI